MRYDTRFEVIVVGGGHAGTEAALAAARIGARTLLLTHQIETIGQMSCNPAIGGIGKGHLVREIDALGGVMAWAADRAGIQWRTLNGSKGPAVRATRCQADRALYRAAIRCAVENQPNLTLFQQAVDDLLLDGDRVAGVLTQMGLSFAADTVVLTAGTFLSGLIHIGEVNYRGGRAGDPPAQRLGDRLRELPLGQGRLKTGTPPRIDGRSIDYSQLTEQPGDQPAPIFSFIGSAADHPRQLPCWITHTSERTHELIRGALHRSPLYSGKIEGIGPRYCPSIEDKVVRFAEKSLASDLHRTRRLEHPRDLPERYLDQLAVRCATGAGALDQGLRERAHHAARLRHRVRLLRSARPQALAGDQGDRRPVFCRPDQWHHRLRRSRGAGAAGRASMRRARCSNGRAWCPRRDEAYLGVLVDDLITHGTTEPYRMFTSRAEYRLQLREDNADVRLTPIGRELGLVDDTRWEAYSRKREAVLRESERLRGIWATPGNALGQQFAAVTGASISRETHGIDLLKRPDLGYATLTSVAAFGPPVDDPAVAEQVEIEAKYSGYVDRQRDEIERSRRHEDARIPDGFDYQGVIGLSAEVLQKLIRVRPATLGQAGRIPGVTPAAVSLLLVHLKRRVG